MKQDQFKQLVQKLKRPESILVIVFLFGILINAGFFVNKYQPESSRANVISMELELLELRKEMLEGQPIPEPLDPDSVSIMLDQIPTSTESEKLFQQLNELEKSSGTTLLFLSENEKDATEDELTQVVQEQTQNQTAESENASNDSSTPTEEIVKLNTPIKEHKFLIRIQGKYPQLMTFLEGLYQNSRLIKVDNIELSTDNTAKATMSLEIIVYSNETYKNSEKEDPAGAYSPANRTDPFILNEEFIGQEP